MFVQRQLQPSWRGNAAVFTVGIVTMESCELLQNVCEVMDGKYDLATPGPREIPTGSGDIVPGPGQFPLKSILLSGAVGLAHACIQSDGVSDPSVQALHLLCSCHVLLGLKSIMPNLWEEFLGLHHSHLQCQKLYQLPGLLSRLWEEGNISPKDRFVSF